MEEFVTKQLKLLAEEHNAEITEGISDNAVVSLAALKRKGFCISKLRIAALKTGLYGRTVATFTLKNTDSLLLPSNNLSSGDIVEIRQPTNKLSTTSNGVVLSVSTKQLIVAFDGAENRDILDALQSDDKLITLVKVANEVTYRRLKKAIQDLNKLSSSQSDHLVNVLFGLSDITSSTKQEGFEFCNPDLNKSQKEAVKFALCQNELAIIHGPPGTGKTTTVVEIIVQLVISGVKVLACAPSNVAVDNLVEKLLQITIKSNNATGAGGKRKIKLVRIGHPARIQKKQLHDVSLDALIAQSDTASIVRDVRSDIEEVQSKLRKRPDKGTMQRLQKYRKELFQELSQREKKALQEILSSADVVLSTNVGAHAVGPLQHVKRDHFDVVVIDECGQALEASCWIPLLNKRKCILSGDHLQLPPTIISKKAASEGLSITLLERLVKLYPKSVVMLVEQYRMHKVIMEWASCQMYDGKLLANKSVEGHLLCDLPNVAKTESTSIPMLLIDTAGCDMCESESEWSDSKANEGEAMIVYQHVTSLVDAGVPPDSIAVISPYNLQVEILRKLLHAKYPSMEIKSVDGFQGREKEAVVFSLVRSNSKREIGFLADNRRLNVAITRARRHLTVVCDSSTVEKHDFLKSLLDYVTQHGEIRTGFEYTSGTEANMDMECFSGLCSLNSQTKPTDHKKASIGERTSKQSTPVINKKPTPTLDGFKRRYTNLLKDFRSFCANDDRPTIDESFDASFEHGNLTFGTSLNSAERKAIHELCEELDLAHASLGEGTMRRIVVSKIKNRPESTKSTEPEIDAIESPHSSKQSAESLNFDPKIRAGNSSRKKKTTTSSPAEIVEEDSIPMVVCENCEKRLPQANLNLHLMHCRRVMKIKETMEASKAISSKNVSTSKKKKSGNNVKKSKRTDISQKNKIEDDEDLLLDSAIASSRTCCHANCKSFVTTTGQLCSVCKRMFCLKHSLPELHGCGRGVRSQARRQISRDGVLYNGGGVPDNKLPADKRTVLRNKLAIKVKSMEDARKGTRIAASKNT